VSAVHVKSAGGVWEDAQSTSADYLPGYSLLRPLLTRDISPYIGPLYPSGSEFFYAPSRGRVSALFLLLFT